MLGIRDARSPGGVAGGCDTQEVDSLILPLCRDGSTRVLITTDVWARGLDVQQVCWPGLVFVFCSELCVFMRGSALVLPQPPIRVLHTRSWFRLALEAVPVIVTTVTEPPNLAAPFASAGVVGHQLRSAQQP